MLENPVAGRHGLPLDDIFPGDPAIRPVQALQEFFRAVLMRTNFVPVARHVIGWRGLKRAQAPYESWTARIRGCAGVFGTSFSGLDLAKGWIRGRFELYYFPDPEEELVEACSLGAAQLTQDADYMSWVREFPSNPEAAELFRIAGVLLGVDVRKQGVALGLEAATSLRGISGPGVSAHLDGREVVLVEPGGVDFDFPAFDTASAFFDVMASSLTFNFGQAPVFLRERSHAGSEVFQDGEGGRSTRAAGDIRMREMLIGYGSGDFGEMVASSMEPLSQRVWTHGAAIPDDLRLRPWWSVDRLQAPSSLDRKLLGLDVRPPLIILTGFLGSGKTSFLRQFIEFQTRRSRFVAVIQNEIGAVGLDGKMLDYTVTEIDEGCVCCSLAGSLKRAVHAILSDFRPDCIIVETTGLANPLNMREEMEELEDMTRLDCTLTVVDAANAMRTLDVHPIATDQIRAADIVMLNKKDLVYPRQLETVTLLVRERNPHAPIFPTVNGDLHPDLILDAETRPAFSAPSTGKGLVHLSHLHEGLWSESVFLTAPVERGQFLETVDRLPASVFRIKGVVEFTDSAEPMLFQYVGGRYEISVFAAQTDPGRFLTLIGQGDALQRTAEAIRALCGTAA